MMKLLCAVLAFIFACSHVTEAAHWALLVSGSKGYYNYRHQADVAHSYQILRKHGYSKSNIVTMMYDDVANNYRNPHKGNLINKPGGPNVYAGIYIDYRGHDVTAKNFISVLKGEKTLMNGIGSGKVIESGPNDHVFVYFADHGAKHLIAFPSGGVLYSRTLISAINYMYTAKKYSKMVFYIEACYSGSMFYNQLENKINVYAATAANPYQSSYACYYDRSRRTYLGDEFSVRWMEDSDKASFNSRTLMQQFDEVKREVRRSQVCHYGDAGITKMTLGQFQGDSSNNSVEENSPPTPITDAVPTWDVPYMILLHELNEATTTESRLDTLQEMRLELEMHVQIRESMEAIAGKFTTHLDLMMNIKDVTITEEQMHCYEQAVDKYRQTCASFVEHDYAMKDLHVFANICHEGEPIESIQSVIEEVCEKY